MLATMLVPQAPSTTAHMSVANKMSVAILPSAPMAYSPCSPSPSKKPKLSLNTTDVSSSVFGKGSTSLRLETLSATSPTSRNTFKNAYKPVQGLRTSTGRSQKLALTHISTNVQPPADQHIREELESSASTASSSPDKIPYKVAFNITSILSNSPLPRKRTRRTQNRAMFPDQKRVKFRAPLTEDIQNVKYTLKHSDIESSTSTISTLELSPPENEVQQSNETAEGKAEGNESTVRKPSPPPQLVKRDSSDEDETDISCPATPIAGRNKRAREWVWTLGPVTQGKPSEGLDGRENRADSTKT